MKRTFDFTGSSVDDIIGWELCANGVLGKDNSD